ncbi:MAG: IPT/TIG domain-containing protein, partial [Acidobacteria bacterium]|nr:IPT/TIG domain-containing protein [Acidobacteriota bacterium]
MKLSRILSFLAVLFLATPAALLEATHFRGTIVTWKNEPTLGAFGVSYTVRFSARRSGYAGTAPDGRPAIGDVVREDIGATSFDFGDGDTTSTLYMRVIAVDAINDTLTAFLEEDLTTTPGKITHVYADGTPLLAFFTSCCRISEDVLNPDGGYRAEVAVTPGGANRCPTSNAASNVDTFPGRTLTLLIAANDADGDSLTYRFATTAESLLDVAPIPGTTLSTGGILTWVVPSNQQLGPYSTQVVISDGVNKIPVDFTITVRDPALGQPPAFIQPPTPCGKIINTNVGSPVSFEVRASDPEIAQQVTLNNTGLPTGATFVAGAPSNPASATFAWTPAAIDNLTASIVVFTASDGVLSATPCSVVIAVGFADLVISKTHAADFTAATNGAFNITVTNQGATANAAPITVTDSLPRGLTFLSGTGPGWTCSNVDALVTCTTSDPLGPLASTSFTINVAVEARAIPSVTNSVRVQSAGEYDQTNNTAQDPVRVGGLDVSLVKNHTGNFTAGQNGVFNLTVKNVGTVPTQPAGPIVVGSVKNSRFGNDWTLDGPNMGSARAKLLNAANFGAGGTIPRAISIVDTAEAVGSITPALLNPFDLFFIGYFPDGASTAFTPDELDALRSYVVDGGTVVVTCDNFNYDNVCNALGYPVLATSPNPLNPDPAAASSPLINGPFGQVGTFQGSQTIGYFFDATGAQVLARNSAGRPVYIQKQLGAGTAFLLSDVDFIAQALTAGSLVTSANDRLLGNLFAYAGKYAPISVTDTLPAGFTFVSATGSGWTCSAAGQTATCKYPGSLTVGASTSITLTGAVAAGATGSLLNTARVSLLNDGNPYNDGAQDTAAISAGAAVPSVNGLTPTVGPAAGGTIVTITGSNLGGTTSVLFGSATATGLTIIDANTITVVTPPSAVAGLVNVTLNAAGPTSATLTNAFLYVATTAGLGFYTLNPCRVIDTRDPVGTFGGPARAAGGSRTVAHRGEGSHTKDAVGVG